MPAPASPHAPRWFAARLALSLWLVLLVHFNPDGAASARFVYLTRAMVEQHTFSVDGVSGSAVSRELLAADVFEKDGHTWVDTNPGMAMLAAPAWLVYVTLARAVHGEQALLDGPTGYYAAHFLGTATTTALATVMVALLLFRWVQYRTGSTTRATLAAVLYAIGTNAFFLSTLLIQHSVVALVTLFFVVALVDPRALGAVSRWRWFAAALGAAGGIALLVDLSIVPALAVLLPLLLWRQFTSRTADDRFGHTVKAAVSFAAGAVPPVALLLWYQWHCFGSALFPAQHYYFAGATVGTGGTFMTMPSASIMAGLVGGMRAGLFVYVPLAIPALWFLATRSRPERSAERRVFFVLAGVYLLYASCFSASVEYGYYGPRYLSPIIPLLCAALAMNVPRFDGAWLRLALGASLAINIMGAQNGLYTHSVPRVIGLWMLRGPWLPVVDQLRGEFGLPSASPYGLLSVMAIALLWLWHPWLPPARQP